MSFRGRFTLVELLVVIAIIGLLAAASMFAISKARNKARESACASNLRQIGLGLNAYTTESKGRLPVCERFAPLYGLPSLKNVLMPHLSNNEKVFQCPSDMDQPTLFSQEGTSYEWNTFLSGMIIDKAAFKIGSFTYDTPVCADGRAFHNDHRNYLHLDGSIKIKLEVHPTGP